MVAPSRSDERRLFERFPAQFPAKFKDTRSLFGEDLQLRDVSGTGAKLLSNQRFFLHDRVSIEVKLPDNSLPMELHGQVVWQKFINSSMWEIGLNFSEVKLLSLQRLLHYAAQA